MSEENNPKLFPTPKKGVWAIHKSKTKGKYYYFNISTGESYWERPKELKDADLSLLHFPEGNFIPENVNTGSAWDKKKQPIKSNKADKSPIKNRKTVKKYAKITADFLKDTEENTVEQCKTCKSKHGSAAREKIKDRLLKGAKHVESSANKQKLLFKKINLVQAEPELPAYTDSDEDEEPVSAKKIKANDGDKICQSKISNFKIPKKIMDSGQSLTETSDIDNREQISGTQRDVAIEQSELIDEYEEMEWSPNPTNNDIDRVETEVESNCTEWSSLENEITPMEIDIANPKDTCLVIDTNILIHDMELVRSITTSDLADGSKIIVVIPWQVLRELDGLKKNEKVRQKCTTAIRFLHQCFSDKSSNVIAQNALSEKLGKDLIEIDVPDDNILACCLQVISLDRRTVLLTNDINLCNKAMAHNIEAYTREEFLKESNSLGLSVKNKGGIRSIKTGFRPHIFGYPPSPPADNLPYSVVKNLLARKHRKCRSENDEESQILVIPLSDDRNKTKGTVDNKPKPSRPASTETISNLISNSLNSESNYEATCNHINIPLQVPVEKPPLPGSVLKNMLPRKSMPTTQKNEQKPTKRSHARSSSGPSIKTTPLQKRLSVSNSVPSPALKSPSCSENQSQVRPSFQAQETSVEMTVAKQFDLFKFVKLSPSDYSSPSWDKFKKFKFAVAEFLFSVLKTGMCRMSRGDWTWRIILSPPWTVEQLCICLRTHWLTLTDHFPSQQILEYLQCLQECINDIDNENMTLENLNMAINMCFLITPPLRNYFNQLVEIFESKLNSLLPKLGVNEEVSHQYWSCFTEDVDPTRCFDLLSKILNKTFKFLVWFQKVFDNCTTFYGDIDFDSPYIFQLYQFEAALKQKLRPITLIIAGLKAILNHGSNVPQDPIDKLTLCLLEETEYPDPFFSKDDVITIALESDYRLCIKEYWIKYEDIRRKLLATLNELVLSII